MYYTLNQQQVKPNIHTHHIRPVMHTAPPTTPPTLISHTAPLKKKDKDKNDKLAQATLLQLTVLSVK